MTLRSTGNPVRTLLTFRCQHFGEQGVTMHWHGVGVGVQVNQSKDRHDLVLFSLTWRQHQIPNGLVCLYQQHVNPAGHSVPDLGSTHRRWHHHDDPRHCCCHVNFHNSASNSWCARPALIATTCHVDTCACSCMSVNLTTAMLFWLVFLEIISNGPVCISSTVLPLF
jgi:hypothetical protein